MIREKLIWALLIAGTVLCCVFNEILAGVIVLVAAIIAIFIMREILIRETYREEADEDGDRMADERFEEMVENATTQYRVHYDRYVVLGKGYQK